MSEPLKKKTAVALTWSFIDKGGQQVIQLVFMFILARLLSTDDFGLIAVLAIFTAVANLLQESGFSSALIRKKEVLNQEYSSIFYFNISISIFLYIVLFFCAPFISAYYDKPILTNLSRFIFLSFVFNALSIIQNVNLVRNMDFKTNTRITLIAGCISGIIAIVMAFSGYGVWSLAAQLVIQSFLRSVFLWIFIKWRPQGGFTFLHIKRMSSFSIKVLLTAILNQVCSNIYAIIIGKYFSISQAGIYGQSVKLNNIPQSVISDGIKSVAYPLLTHINDDERGIRAYRKIMRITAFISFPIALIMIVMAKPIVMILLSEKWIDAIPILQILAVGGSVFPLYSLIATLLQHRGKSGRFFIIELIRNILSLTSILISIRYGVLGLVTGVSIVNILAFFIGYVFVGRVTTYKLKHVLSDIFPYISIAIISFAPLYFFNRIIENNFLLLAVQLILGTGIYILIVKLLGSKVLDDCINLIRRKEQD
ncbi:lipopolysaccharide biosynthesis protein [Dysgonomonas sp. ZJ279]|uniref:lipopolysaccharide biosynthesis protein n=1 Tax=Dysgonomonas sp. ZJ279 TaxID=2709796 RepID=UPI0013EA73AB|nr:lipopolysaccharide biosynthesis protein [Dysgonomonas sp. ZJ279]